MPLAADFNIQIYKEKLERAFKTDKTSREGTLDTFQEILEEIRLNVEQADLDDFNANAFDGRDGIRAILTTLNNTFKDKAKGTGDLSLQTTKSSELNKFITGFLKQKIGALSAEKLKQDQQGKKKAKDKLRQSHQPAAPETLVKQSSSPEIAMEQDGSVSSLGSKAVKMPKEFLSLAKQDSVYYAYMLDLNRAFWQQEGNVSAEDSIKAKTKDLSADNIRKRLVGLDLATKEVLVGGRSKQNIGEDCRDALYFFSTRYEIQPTSGLSVHVLPANDPSATDKKSLPRIKAVKEAFEQFKAYVKADTTREEIIRYFEDANENYPIDVTQDSRLNAAKRIVKRKLEAFKDLPLPFFKFALIAELDLLQRDFVTLSSKIMDEESLKTNLPEVRRKSGGKAPEHLVADYLANGKDKLGTGNITEDQSNAALSLASGATAGSNKGMRVTRTQMVEAMIDSGVIDDAKAIFANQLAEAFKAREMTINAGAARPEVSNLTVREIEEKKRREEETKVAHVSFGKKMTASESQAAFLRAINRTLVQNNLRFEIDKDDPNTKKIAKKVTIFAEPGVGKSVSASAIKAYANEHTLDFIEINPSVSDQELEEIFFNDKITAQEAQGMVISCDEDYYYARRSKFLQKFREYERRKGISDRKGQPIDPDEEIRLERFILERFDSLRLKGALVITWGASQSSKIFDFKQHKFSRKYKEEGLGAEDKKALKKEKAYLKEVNERIEAQYFGAIRTLGTAEKSFQTACKSNIAEVIKDRVGKVEADLAGAKKTTTAAKKSSSTTAVKTGFKLQIILPDINFGIIQSAKATTYSAGSFISDKILKDALANNDDRIIIFPLKQAQNTQAGKVHQEKSCFGIVYRFQGQTHIKIIDPAEDKDVKLYNEVLAQKPEVVMLYDKTNYVGGDYLKASQNATHQDTILGQPLLDPADKSQDKLNELGGNIYELTEADLAQIIGRNRRLNDKVKCKTTICTPVAAENEHDKSSQLLFIPDKAQQENIFARIRKNSEDKDRKKYLAYLSKKFDSLIDEIPETLIDKARKKELISHFYPAETVESNKIFKFFERFIKQLKTERKDGDKQIAELIEVINENNKTRKEQFEREYSFSNLQRVQAAARHQSAATGHDQTQITDLEEGLQHGDHDTGTVAKKELAQAHLLSPGKNSARSAPATPSFSQRPMRQSTSGEDDDLSNSTSSGAASDDGPVTEASKDAIAAGRSSTMGSNPRRVLPLKPPFQKAGPLPRKGGAGSSSQSQPASPAKTSSDESSGLPADASPKATVAINVISPTPENPPQFVSLASSEAATAAAEAVVPDEQPRGRTSTISGHQQVSALQAQLAALLQEKQKLESTAGVAREAEAKVSKATALAASLQEQLTAQQEELQRLRAVQADKEAAALRAAALQRELDEQADQMRLLQQQLSEKESANQSRAGLDASFLAAQAENDALREEVAEIQQRLQLQADAAREELRQQAQELQGQLDDRNQELQQVKGREKAQLEQLQRQKEEADRAARNAEGQRDEALRLQQAAEQARQQADAEKAAVQESARREAESAARKLQELQQQKQREFEAAQQQNEQIMSALRNQLEQAQQLAQAGDEGKNQQIGQLQKQLQQLEQQSRQQQQAHQLEKQQQEAARRQLEDDARRAREDLQQRSAAFAKDQQNLMEELQRRGQADQQKDLAYQQQLQQLARQLAQVQQDFPQFILHEIQALATDHQINAQAPSEKQKILNELGNNFPLTVGAINGDEVDDNLSEEFRAELRKLIQEKPQFFSARLNAAFAQADQQAQELQRLQQQQQAQPQQAPTAGPDPRLEQLGQQNQQLGQQLQELRDEQAQLVREAEARVRQELQPRLEAVAEENRDLAQRLQEAERAHQENLQEQLRQQQAQLAAAEQLRVQELQRGLQQQMEALEEANRRLKEEASRLQQQQLLQQQQQPPLLPQPKLSPQQKVSKSKGGVHSSSTVGVHGSSTEEIAADSDNDHNETSEHGSHGRVTPLANEDPKGGLGLRVGNSANKVPKTRYDDEHGGVHIHVENNANTTPQLPQQAQQPQLQITDILQILREQQTALAAQNAALQEQWVSLVKAHQQQPAPVYDLGQEKERQSLFEERLRLSQERMQQEAERRLSQVVQEYQLRYQQLELLLQQQRAAAASSAVPSQPAAPAFDAEAERAKVRLEQERRDAELRAAEERIKQAAESRQQQMQQDYERRQQQIQEEFERRQRLAQEETARERQARQEEIRALQESLRQQQQQRGGAAVGPDNGEAERRQREMQQEFERRQREMQEDFVRRQREMQDDAARERLARQEEIRALQELLRQQQQPQPRGGAAVGPDNGEAERLLRLQLHQAQHEFQLRAQQLEYRNQQFQQQAEARIQQERQEYQARLRQMEEERAREAAARAAAAPAPVPAPAPAPAAETEAVRQLREQLQQQQAQQAAAQAAALAQQQALDAMRREMEEARRAGGHGPAPAPAAPPARPVPADAALRGAARIVPIAQAFPDAAEIMFSRKESGEISGATTLTDAGKQAAFAKSFLRGLEKISKHLQKTGKGLDAEVTFADIASIIVPRTNQFRKDVPYDHDNLLILNAEERRALGSFFYARNDKKHQVATYDQYMKNLGFLDTDSDTRENIVRGYNSILGQDKEAIVQSAVNWCANVTYATPGTSPGKPTATSLNAKDAKAIIMGQTGGNLP